LVGKLAEKQLLGRPRREMGNSGGRWMQLAQNCIQ